MGMSNYRRSARALALSDILSSGVGADPGERHGLKGGWQMRVLIVEDDRKIAQFVVKGLKQAGYAVNHASDGEEGEHLLRSEAYDAAVVDIMLPKRDGLTLVGSIRGSGCRTPVIFLSARREINDRVQGLQVGGDDYLVKPFAFSELLARLQALMRRASGASESTNLTVGDLRLDIVKRRVTWDGKYIDLQPREFSLLEYMMRNVGKVVSKTTIMEHVWDYNFDPETNVVETCVCRLRTKLKEGAGRDVIRTIRGVGYVLDEQPA